MAELNNHRPGNVELEEFYRKAGFMGRVGWGERPALLVIDMAEAWTDPNDQIGTDLSGVEAAILPLLDIFREQGLPIFFTTMAWDPSYAEVGEVIRRKTPHSGQMVKGDGKDILLPSLNRRPEEPLIVKPRASGFFGTNLAAMLVSAKADTTIVVGCSTSGCIRGTAESAFNLGYHVIVPEEAVGDRSFSAHQANLFDIDARYADVMPLADVISHLESEPASL